MVTHLIPSKDNRIIYAIACGGWYTLTCDIMDMKDVKTSKWIPIEDFPCPTGNCENAKFG